MAMEAHSLQFVRCPKCHQLLVEYPSIPVYKCGGCGTVLRAKHRAVPGAQAASESEERNGFPCGLKGSPQNIKSVCSDEQKAVSSVDQPCEATTHGSISSTEHPNEEACFVIHGKIQNSGIMVKEVHDKDTGADSSSSLAEKVEIADASENANGGEVNNVGPSELSMTLYEKGNVVHRVERLYTYEGMHAESHKALIEELERSLSFSSDDDYFSDEAENSGLSDALRNQMGSRRFVLGGKMNDAPRSDPHGRLIEELEMSFSDEEETLQQHAVVADGFVHDKDPQTLGAESAHPCEESLLSFDNGHLNSKQSSHQEKWLVGKGNEEKEYSEDDNNTANCVHGSEHSHIVIADDEIAERFYEKEDGKDWQSADTVSAYHCEGSASSVEDGSIKVKQSFQPNDLAPDVTQEMEEARMEDDKMTILVHGNGSLVLADEDIVERVHGNEQLAADGTQETQEGCMEDDGMINCVCGNDNILFACENIAERVHGNEELTADGAQEMEDDNMTNPIHGNDNLMLADEDIAEIVRGNEQLAAIGTQEMEEGHMEDDNMTNYVHGNDNLVLANEAIAGRVHGNEEITADGTQEMEDDNMTNCIHGNGNLVLADEHAEEVHGNEEIADGIGENEESCMANVENENKATSIADEDIAKKVHDNEHDKDQQSLEAESAHLCEGIFSSLGAVHIKSEQNFEQDEPTADGAKEKEEGYMEDGNTASCVREKSSAVARFSSLPNKRTQYKLASFNKNKDQMAYRYRGSQLRQGHSLDSEDFNAIQNFMESRMDGTSSSVSSGSPSQGDLVHRTANKFNNIVRHERLKKMDELRDQLSRLSSQKGSERSYQKRGLEYQQQSNSYDAEQHLQSVDGGSIPRSCALESYYGHGRPPRYQPLDPFSPTNTYARYHLGHAQARLPQNYDPWEFNSYYQPSYSESTVLDHESLMSSYKEQRRMVRKHILRPLSGASPFTICNSCFNLVQMPSDIYISKSKVGKMQCGKCSKVLALSFPAVHNTNAKTSVDAAQESRHHEGRIFTKSEDISSCYAECLIGGPVSMSEDHGASYTRSLPTQGGPSSLAATHSGKKVSDSALHRLMGYESASLFLLDSRVFEDGCGGFGVNVASFQ